ncbi:MAG: hypothetical protein ACXACK_17750 [Candidatus Hodarchaeales archaeon]|jgi:hypothetical protein
MQEHEISLGMHKRSSDPELRPFLISRNNKIMRMVGIIGIPIAISAIILASILFFDQQLILLIIVVTGIISLILSVVVNRSTYRGLRRFQISGSILSDFMRLIETFGLRIQAVLFPIIILLFMVSFITSNNEEGSSDLLGAVVQLVGIFLVFVSVLLILNTFLNQVDAYNGRVMSLDDRTLDEDFRIELKQLGQKLGFDNVKIRLADIRPNYFGKLAVGATDQKTVYLAYSKIAKFQAEREQSFVYCAREVIFLSLENRKLFHVTYSIHNFLFTLYLGLAGFYLYSSSAEIKLIQTELGIICIASIILLMIADAFLKAYLSSYDLLLELKADEKTVKILTSMNHSNESVKRYLRITEEVDPLSTSYPGFKFRRNALMPKSDRKVYWDEL